MPIMVSIPLMWDSLGHKLSLLIWKEEGQIYIFYFKKIPMGLMVKNMCHKGVGLFLSPLWQGKGRWTLLYVGIRVGLYTIWYSNCHTPKTIHKKSITLCLVILLKHVIFCCSVLYLLSHVFTHVI